MIKDEKFEQGHFAFEISYISEKGGRAINEDSVVVSHNDENIVLAVADGLGAHGGGDVASGIASDIVKEEYLKLSSPKNRNIYDIFSTINDSINSRQTEKLKMKTTLSCLLCRNKRIYAAHLGDTRIYTFKNNNKTYITADHSIAFEEMIKNHGSPDDIRTNPNRHILNAALGVDYSQHPVTFKHRIKNNLSFLICSDGFWEYVLEDEMLLALVNTQTAREWLEKMLEFHRKKTDTSNDNYSAICLKITKK